LELWVGLYGLLFLSGNDAARAIAENIGGSESDFAKLMNSRAHRIGADNTQFVNPHGLSAAGHYSTAFDLALITREALKNQTLARIVGRTTRTLPWRGGTRSLSNINKFMYRYSGATGVKTGYTTAAGYCLAAAATRDGRRLLAILLGAPSSEARWQDAIRIMDYGFANFTSLLKNAPSRPSVAGNGAGGVGGAGSAAIPAGAHPYRVRQGDTIYSLAKRAGIDIATILKLNPGLDPDHIRVGQQLALPGAPTD
jgi:D-alanyl-D-alanine carboxypeptidase